MSQTGKGSIFKTENNMNKGHRTSEHPGGQRITRICPGWHEAHVKGNSGNEQ